MMWRFSDCKTRIAAKDDRGDSITYQDLSDLEEHFAKAAKRKLVFCMANNELGSLAGYVAMINAGVVPVMLSYDIDPSLLRNLVEQYQPDFIWMNSANWEGLDTRTQTAFYHGKGSIFSASGYSLIQTDYKCSLPIYDDLALLLTTSGSTGSPKFVRQSYDNIKANTKSIVEYLKLDADERPITTLPMSYTYGLSIINSHLYVGATILMTNKTLMQKEFWEFFKAEKATSFGGVPYTYEMLKKLRLFRMELPSLRTMTQAGGKLTTALHKEFAEYAADTGRNFVVMYGQTEATARMAYLPGDKALDKIGSMGIAIPGGNFQLIDVDGREITDIDTVGELVYTGANVTLGYAQCREDLVKGDERGGILETGDMAKRDSDGYYYIVGRKKRFLKIFGKRVNLDEVDRLIKMQFDNIDCASTGQDDALHIFITDKDLVDDVRQYIADITKTNLSAVHVQHIDEIPKSDSGKVLYVELEKYYKNA